jgi:hypothetical protein
MKVVYKTHKYYGMTLPRESLVYFNKEEDQSKKQKEKAAFDPVFDI